ncbi:Gfo/Idh/MocA family protein [Metabacillus endolithicus]|uniref:Gfo/Idh/MocA family protein n=1 Tax=Metabacillus endolithicus TaxID=1535204 RepID=A0ABW5BRM2_9BACI|nr:Gfo/Idh/MocA family oxidoreductase [Metabacillus endolithicus]UPG63347.1 Gfo/Idh/MocA family oxidoreductase [Metabacillus endolithicus]
MQTQKIRLGIIGAGAIGSVHLTTFSKLSEDVVLQGITDAYLPLAEQRAKEFGVKQVFSSAEELIHDSDIDAVIIGVPNKWHAPLAIQALKAGKHVLVEKPMGINSEAAKDIVRAQRESGKVVMVGHQMRWQWNIQQVKEQAEKGALGRIYHAKTGWFRRKGIPGWGSWFTTKSEAGGGPLIDIGVHMLDLALYLMGNPKPVSVFGSTYAEFGPKKKGIGNWGTPNWEGQYDVEDLATALIKMEDGSTLTLEVSWAVNMDTSNEPFIHLMGSEGGASLGGNSAKILTEQFDRPIDIELSPDANEEEDRVQLSRHFIECVRNGNQPITSAMTGLTNNLILDAIYESSKTGREVVLDWNI